MSLRTSILLALALAGVLSWIYFVEIRQESPSKPPLWFYQVEDMNLIISIEVTHQGERYAYSKNDGWHFDDPEESPVYPERWGGITLLLSGPQSPRIVAEAPEDLAQFGLDQPETIIKVGLEGGEEFTVFLGRRTPDGVSQYARIQALTCVNSYNTPVCPQVFLVDSTWGNALSRLVTEPPYMPAILPTPTLVPNVPLYEGPGGM